MNEKISVVLTTHNRLEDLPNAVESVLKQTYTDFELIVVNDNSTDETQKYLEELTQNNSQIRVIFIGPEETKGGNYARNKGVALSKGKYVAFLDDDDVWFESKLEKQVHLIQSNDQIGLVFCGLQKAMNGNFMGYNFPQSDDKGDVSKKIFTHVFTVTSAIMLRRSVFFEVGGFDEQLTHWQEYDLTIRIAQKYQFDYVNEILVLINDSTSKAPKLSNNLDKWLRSVELINKKYSKEIESLTTGQKIEKDNYFLTDLAGRYYKMGNKKAHRQTLKKMWLLTGNKKYFVRYVFNLNYEQVAKIRLIFRRARKEF
ncbi:glycosyltransferase family 2 protein [Lactococcus laudensis]|uniref:glycosyltransferase family 2 protein n=1 Tax=Pseudolactococcus laudensis TaxID=1494461 RepID=UPI002FC5CD7B